MSIASFRQQKPLKKYHYFQDFSDAKNCNHPPCHNQNLSKTLKNKTKSCISLYMWDFFCNFAQNLRKEDK